MVRNSPSGVHFTKELTLNFDVDYATRTIVVRSLRTIAGSAIM